MPYLIPALRLAAAAAVVGAIVAEISTGTRGGIGRLIIEYAQTATGDPSQLYAAILGAAVLGLVAAGLVSLLDLALWRYRPVRRPMSVETAAEDRRRGVAVGGSERDVAGSSRPAARRRRARARRTST